MEAKTKFAICVKNEDYPSSLQLWKVYRVLPDDKAATRNLIRVVDESGEDYLFSATCFVPVELPKAAENALLALA
ncbi:MAG: hypothetical protein WKF92_13150 [Pyrinomonadaceae bacterium]